mgnify:CR=1 FL=1
MNKDLKAVVTFAVLHGNLAQREAALKCFEALVLCEVDENAKEKEAEAAKWKTYIHNGVSYKIGTQFHDQIQKLYTAPNCRIPSIKLLREQLSLDLRTALDILSNPQCFTQPVQNY